MAGALMLGTVAGGAAGAVAGSRFGAAPAAVQAPAAVAPAPAAPAASTNGGAEGLAAIYERVAPSVVYIQARLARGGAVGTGFVIDTNGHVVTNHHVVEGAQGLTVRFEDGSEATARVVGRDPSGDIALIKVDAPAARLRPVALGDSDAVRPGDTAIAIGNPLGLDYSITAGIVSAIDRTQSEGGPRPLRGLIQTDAAINQGNSGGPLLNAKGEVIGVNTLGLGSTGAQNLNFAIPINTVKRLLPRLMAGETVQHAWMGVSTREVTAANAGSLGASVDRGVYVAEVQSGSPAARAGLRSGDVILAVEGTEVRRPDDLGKLLDGRRPGETVTLRVARAGQTVTLNLTLGAAPTS
jgi:S1-C subfamily serine protease